MTHTKMAADIYLCSVLPKTFCMELTKKHQYPGYHRVHFQLRSKAKKESGQGTKAKSRKSTSVKVKKTFFYLSGE